jgi:hypothetical protein
MGRIVRAVAVVAGLVIGAPAWAGISDLADTPNAIGEGIAKTLEEQIGAGRGEAAMTGSSCYVIARDPFRAIRRGRQLFQRKFTVVQGFGPRAGDGVGDDIDRNPALGAGLADSCAACHGRPRGSAGVGGEVFTRPDSRDAPHLFGLGLQEMLADEMTSELRALRAGAVAAATAQGRQVRVALTAKDVPFGELVAHADGSVDTSGVEGVDADLRVKPFFAHGGSHSIRQFVVGAFNDEMGLQAADPDLAAAAVGQRVVTPSGFVLDGSLDAISAPPAADPNYDPDGDGVTNEIDAALVDHMEFYLLNYFKPATYQRNALTERGRRVMQSIGCTECHRPALVVEHDRRIADVETVFDPVRGHFNRLFATAVPQFREVIDDSGLPPLREPAGGRFVVENFYSDLKRHDLGPGFWERNFDGSMRYEFVTEPLWGVGSTAPYGHDGRSINLHEAILRHGGEAQRSRHLYAAAPAALQLAVRAFLESLVIFPPDDTASNLDPGDPTVPGFPQQGHGSIRLSALFLDPAESE